MEEQIEQLKHVEQQLECQKTELKVELERNAKRAQEDMESLRRQHAEEVESLQQSNKQLKVMYLHTISVERTNHSQAILFNVYSPI